MEPSEFGRVTRLLKEVLRNLAFLWGLGKILGRWLCKRLNGSQSNEGHPPSDRMA